MANGLEVVRKAQDFLDALDRDDNYGWGEEQGFMVCIPDNNSAQWCPRHPSAYIARELDRIRRGHHDGEPFAFWVSQALHYGIRPSLDQDRIQRDFEYKLTLEGGSLIVPTRLLCLCQRIQDQVQSASLESEIKQEEEENPQIPAEKDHEQVTGNSASEPRRRREDSLHPNPPVRPNSSARGDDGGIERDQSRSLGLAATSLKALPHALCPAPTQTCQDRSVVQHLHSGGKATTPTSILADRTRFPQPHQTPFEVVIPSQFSDVDSYLTASSPIPTTVSEHAQEQHKNSPRNRRTRQSLNRAQTDQDSAHQSLEMGAGLSAETSDDDDANSSRIAKGFPVTQEGKTALRQAEDDAISQQDLSLYLANLSNGRTQGNKTASTHAIIPPRSQGTFQQPSSRSNSMRRPRRSKSSSKQDLSVHSVAETDAPANEDEEQAQLQEALRVSAEAAQVDSQRTTETDSRRGRTWGEYLQEQPQSLQTIPLYPTGWKPDLIKYPHMPYIVQEIRSRLNGGLHSDTAIQFCVELADGDPDLSYQNYVDAAGIKEVDPRPMGAYMRWISGYEQPETHASLGRVATATHQIFPTSQSSPSDEMDLSGQTLVPSSQAIEQQHGRTDKNHAYHNAHVAMPRPNLTAMAKNPRPCRSQDEMDIGVLYHAESRHRGYYVRTYETMVQNMFPVNALTSAWEKIEAEERLLLGLGLRIPPRDGYDPRAKRGKERREYVAKKSASGVDLGPVNRALTVLPRSHSHGNLSYEGHTNISWQLRAMEDASSQSGQAEKPAGQAATSGRSERNELSRSQSSEYRKQMDPQTQTAIKTISPQNLRTSKRKRAAPDTWSMTGNDSSMAAFGEKVKRRKNIPETEIRRSSAPFDGRLNSSPAGTRAPNVATASRGYVIPPAGDGPDAGVEPLPSGDPSSPEEWECDWESCACKYGTIKELYDHVRVVHVGYEELGNLNLRCFWGECRSELSYQSTAVGHILTHVPYAPHVCDRCGKAYKTRVKLRDHVCQPSDTHSNDFNSFNDVPATAPNAPPPEGLEEAQLASSAPKQHVQMGHSDDHAAELVQGQDLPNRQSSREDAEETPISPVQDDSTLSKHNDEHINARSATNEDNETTQQPSMAANPSPSTKAHFPIKLLPEKGNGLDFYEIDEEATLTQYEATVSSLPNGGPQQMRKRHKMWRKVVAGIRAGTIESSAEAQLRLGREQRNTLKATLQETSDNDVAEDLRTNLERVRTKVTKARKVVSEKWDD